MKIHYQRGGHRFQQDTPRNAIGAQGDSRMVLSWDCEEFTCGHRVACLLQYGTYTLWSSRTNRATKKRTEGCWGVILLEGSVDCLCCVPGVELPSSMHVAPKGPAKNWRSLNEFSADKTIKMWICSKLG